eukprot:CAMPEP_0197247760 /NCGR_PEP_ID=MMETSP1429-20130617/31993_1 /TAXON_ID=49237 /ORGANISM="Chaetoceros  sp., Strain UNC1202" /LENGTH=274 /DNA_ID=CAMNT_0042708757 /DNA_START=134 /DNA_END=958 /DNA_ORIENTATION=+
MTGRGTGTGAHSIMEERCWTSAVTNHHHQSQQRRTMFIQTTETPNPESIKFLPGRPVLTTETTGDAASSDSPNLSGFYVTKSETQEISRSPLAKILFQVDGIKGVYLGPDFITITKFAEANWAHVRTLVFSAIMDHYASGKPALQSTPEITDTTILDDDDEIVAMIKELLESRIRPAVMEDGGDIRYVDFHPDSGLVQVQLAGSCVGCPSSSVTLKNGVENMLMHYIPEVTGVEAIEEEGEGEDGAPTVDPSEDEKKAKSYEDRLRAAGIPFSD